MITAGWCDLSTGGAYPRQLAEAHGWDHTNLGVIVSDFVQPYGHFNGTIAVQDDDGERYMVYVKDAFGVVENHRALW